ETQVGLFAFDRLISGATSEHKSQIEFLKAVMLVVVESVQEGPAIEIAVVQPSAADRAGNCSSDSVDARRPIDLAKGKAQFIVAGDASGGDRGGKRVGARVSAG